MNHLVIMAGGSGTRFWPMSTEECPKQFIDVLGVGRSLMQLTYDRFKGICDADNVWVLTNEKYVQQVHEQLPDVPMQNILGEPCRRNTAPCIAYASYRIKVKDADANIVVTPSDAVVMNVEEFRRVIKGALDFSVTSNGIVTLGMKPTRPETGYGYIQANLSATTNNKEIFGVDQFREKPNLETAMEYVKQDCYFWNAGIFIWNVKTITAAFEQFQPKMSAIFQSMSDVFGTEKEQEVLNVKYAECDNISVDYAIMEHSKNIYVMPADFGWSDLGTWGSLLTLTDKDKDGNGVISENVKTFETTNCIINVEGNKQTVIQGLDGYIVAQKDGRLLICKLAEEQRIKEFQK